MSELMVGFCGAGSTGKTSVAKELAADPTIGEEFYPSIVRDTMTEFGVTEKTSLDLSAHDMKLLQYAIFEAKINQDKRGWGIYDRTPIDQLSYCVTRCYKEITDQEYNRLLITCLNGMKQYDLVVYFPPYSEIVYVDDGFRATGLAWRDLQAHTMLGYLNMMHIKALHMPMCTVEERVSIIKSRMGAIRKSRRD
jgi:predicted ATPase